MVFKQIESGDDYPLSRTYRRFDLNKKKRGIK
jgi:hypothetical protein